MDICYNDGEVEFQYKVMASKLSISKFHGLPQEDGCQFLTEFQSYAILNQLDGQFSDSRKVAAFHLLLAGPALVWFSALGAREKDTWAHVKSEFSDKYCMVGQDNPALIADAEMFSKIKLAPGQSMDEYHALIVQKGRKLQKSPRDILVKFVDGLPHQLAFFVRTGNPFTDNEALTAAKMGEAYGYRLSDNICTAVRNPEHPPSANAEIASLKADVAALTKAVGDLSTKMCDIPAADTRPTRPRGPCYNCGQNGHYRNTCTAPARGQNRTWRCQICQQQGHSARDCQEYRQQGNQ